MRSRLAAITLPLVLTILLFVSCSCGQRDRPTRLVLITIDTLRHDAFFGESGGPTPMPLTAAFAERGAVFESFYAATNVTQPTHATLFTGKHPWQHGVTRNGQILLEEQRTVAEELREAGFATGAVVASFPLAGRFGFAQGFAEYLEPFEFELGDGVETWVDVPIDGSRFYSLADRISDGALDLIGRTTSPKQFFWFHYFDPHDPYGDTTEDPLPMAELVRSLAGRDADRAQQFRRAKLLYEDDVASLDAALGRLFEGLEADESRFDTHVVFTSDHGESFGERGGIGHGQQLTPAELRVPLFIVSPGVEPERRTDQAGSIDVMATLLALAGLDARSAAGRDLTASRSAGTSPVVGMRRSFPNRRNRFYAVVGGVIWSGNAKRVRDEGSRARGAGAEAPQNLAALFGGFERLLENAASVEAIDEEGRRALEALGYAP
jgi:arylsulfatase A-like enzyme